MVRGRLLRRPLLHHGTQMLPALLLPSGSRMFSAQHTLLNPLPGAVGKSTRPGVEYRTRGRYRRLARLRTLVVRPCRHSLKLTMCACPITSTRPVIALTVSTRLTTRGHPIRTIGRSVTALETFRMRIQPIPLSSMLKWTGTGWCKDTVDCPLSIATTVQ